MRRTLLAIALLALAGGTHASQESAARSDTGAELVATEVQGHGLSFLVYRSPDDAEVVNASSEAMSLAYRVLADAIGINPEDIQWAEVAFTRNESYVAPRDKQGVVRWVVPLSAAGAMGAAGEEQLFSTIPHEQVHALQKAFGELPRWFSEGMAEWAGLRATKRVSPALYAARKEELDAAARSATAPPDLKSWGGVKPKPEAIFRQLTPEQKQRMAREPGYFPPGPFTFGPDDFISDESNTFARYAASLRVFEAMESASSDEAMRAWFQAVRDLPSPKTTSDIVKLAKEIAGVDISAMVN